MGFVVKRPSRMEEQCFFSFSGGAGSYFRAGLEKIRAGQKFRGRAAPARNMESLLVRGGVFNVLRPLLIPTVNQVGVLTWPKLQLHLGSCVALVIWVAPVAP
jgi:hypothetical protein